MDNLMDLLVMEGINKIANKQARELSKVMKGLMKVFSDGLAVWKEWRTIGLLRDCAVSHLVGRLRKR